LTQNCEADAGAHWSGPRCRAATRRLGEREWLNDAAKERNRRMASRINRARRAGAKSSTRSTLNVRPPRAFIASATARGQTLPGTAYDDGGLSGGTMERPQQLRPDIAAKPIGCGRLVLCRRFIIQLDCARYPGPIRKPQQKLWRKYCPCCRNGYYRSHRPGRVLIAQPIDAQTGGRAALGSTRRLALDDAHRKRPARGSGARGD